MLAAVTAWISPVKCRLISSIGSTCAYPPPVAPPFSPNTGPSDGSRRAIIVRLPKSESACPSPMAVVVLPSPAGVGLTAVTRISLPCGLSRCSSRNCSESLALLLP